MAQLRLAKFKARYLSIIVAITVLLSIPTASSLAATITLVPSSSTSALEVGKTFNVDIKLDTKGKAVDAVDIYFLRFDPKILEVVDGNAGASGVNIVVSNTLPLTMVNQVDNAKGTIMFSQTATMGSAYTGSGNLGSITFKTKAAGSSDVKFDFTPGSTTDTNVAAAGSDILTSAGSLKVTVINQGGEQPEASAGPNEQPSENLPDTQSPDEDITEAGDSETVQENTPTDAAQESSTDRARNIYLWSSIVLIGAVLTYVIYKLIKRRGAGDNENEI